MWYLNEFQEHLRSEQLTAQTISNYHLHVGRFIRYDNLKGTEDSNPEPRPWPPA